MAAVTPVNPKPSSRTFCSVGMTTSATAVSDLVNLTGLTLSCVQMPAAWTDAGIGFQGSADGSTNVVDIFNTDGTFTVFQTSASRVVAFNPAQFSGIQMIRLVSETTAGVQVAQAAVRTLILGLSEFVHAD